MDDFDFHVNKKISKDELHKMANEIIDLKQEKQ